MPPAARVFARGRWPNSHPAAGEHIEKLDCGDGDGIDDWVCINNATGQRAVLLSSSDCTLDYWPQADKSLCPNRFSGEPCPQPDNWCDGSGEVLARSDCGDGDGVDDWTCIQPDTSRRAVLLSSSNCTLDYWSDAAKSLCPPRFNGLMCPLPWDDWCVGEGLVREKLDCGDGDTILDWTCIKTNTSWRNCSDTHWPDANKTLCPSRFSDAVCALPDGWCEESEGEVLHRGDCGDGDGVSDWACIQANTSRRAVLLSSSCDTVSDGWPTAERSTCPLLFNGIMCPLPYDWCDEDDGRVLAAADCGDGDTIDDWVCVQPATGQRKVLLSTSNCSDDYWPQADKALCPTKFNHSMCPMPYDWWCEGDGYTLEKTDCGDGDGVDDWVCTYPATGQRKVLISSSDCSTDYWPQADKSLCPLRLNQAVCPMPYDWWCKQPGDVLEQTDCGDGDGVDDWVCINPDTWMRKVLLSSSNCSDDYGPAAPRSLCPPRFAKAMCYWSWGDSCSGDGFTRQRVDCGDGDGIDDWICIQHNTSYRGVLLSSSDCTESHWSNADKALCPPYFDDLPCALPWDGWCVGENLLREQADCGDGDTVLDWTCIETNTSRRGVLLSSNCTQDHWGDPDKSLCPARFANLMCPLRYYWCDQPGDQLQSVSCGDGDTIDDWVCMNNATGQRKVLLSSSDCSDDHSPQAETALCPARFTGAVCPQPDYWCYEEGDHLERVDCGDGDGVDDWVCMTNATGQRKVLLSSSDCTDDHAPQADKALCPNRFASEPCPQPDYWCYDEGEHIEKLDCGDGDGIDDWVCINNATGQRAVLLSSSNCTLDYWPQADKALCPNRFNSKSQ
eukprot:XP_001698771.1 predicted protein [Chlamydomonas reinhardtii]